MLMCFVSVNNEIKTENFEEKKQNDAFVKMTRNNKNQQT